METMQLDLLGVRFAIQSTFPGLLACADTFMGAYCEEPGWEPDRVMHVELCAGMMPDSHSGIAVPVHTSGHKYWNITGTLLCERPRIVCWPSRGLSITLDAEKGWMKVVADPGRDVGFLGEGIFHACRGLALYLRNGARGNLVHASAVDIGGKGVLFLGAASAGKTTLMTEALLHHGARPLANDRVLLTTGREPEVISWPSYVSYCEGTLLRYPQLKRAALDYESEAGAYCTQRRGMQLRPLFTKQAKRTYPMRWLCDILSTCYGRRRRLGAIVLVRINTSIGDTRLDMVDWESDESVRELHALLSENSFDESEPSFHPWHGLPLPGNTPPLSDLLERLRLLRLPVIHFETFPSGLDTLAEIVQIIHGEHDERRHYSRGYHIT